MPWYWRDSSRLCLRMAWLSWQRPIDRQTVWPYMVVNPLMYIISVVVVATSNRQPDSMTIYGSQPSYVYNYSIVLALLVHVYIVYRFIQAWVTERKLSAIYWYPQGRIIAECFILPIFSSCTYFIVLFLCYLQQDNCHIVNLSPNVDYRQSIISAAGGVYLKWVHAKYRLMVITSIN